MFKRAEDWILFSIIYNNDTDKYYFSISEKYLDDFQIVGEAYKMKYKNSEFHKEFLGHFTELVKADVKKSVFSILPYKVTSFSIKRYMAKEMIQVFINSAIKSGAFNLYESPDLLKYRKSNPKSRPRINWRHVIILKELRGDKIPKYNVKLTCKSTGVVVTGVSNGNETEHILADLVHSSENDMNHTSIRAYNAYFENKFSEDFELEISNSDDSDT